MSSRGLANLERYVFRREGARSVFLNISRAEATKLFSGLQAQNYLKGLPADQFSERGAHFLAELNAIHAFREGNGRTQLTFFALLADQAGKTLGLEKLDPEAMLHAMIASFDGDESGLAAIINELVGA